MYIYIHTYKLIISNDLNIYIYMNILYIRKTKNSRKILSRVFKIFKIYEFLLTNEKSRNYKSQSFGTKSFMLKKLSHDRLIDRVVENGLIVIYHKL